MAELSTGTSTALHVRAAARTAEACKIYGKDQTAVRALDGVTVAFEQSRFTAIMGPSGSGKSTLLHCSAGLDSLSSGRAFIGEVDLAALDDNALTLLRREKVAPASYPARRPPAPEGFWTTAKRGGSSS